jgi:general secretion pathway protein G
MYHFRNTGAENVRVESRNQNSSLRRARRLHPGAYTPGSPGAARPAFTLVEMMVVIVIIAILAGLLLPAIQTARMRANEAKVTVEIKGLESAIAAFKAKYGVEPPSRFSLYLTQTGWSNDPVSTAIVRQIWPQFDFTMGDSTNSGASAGTAYPLFWWKTFGTTGLNMNSGECLLFFVGGVIPYQNDHDMSGNALAGARYSPTGFAKNPVYPFAPPSQSANREGPFFEFTDISRINDFPGDGTGNGINEWYDPLPYQPGKPPYLYFSSYDGSGYRIAELSDTAFTVFATGLHDVYRVSPQYVAPPTSPSSTASASQTLPAQKGQTFQIISPGYDGLIGFGGVYNAQLPNSGLTLDPVAKNYPDGDNITNFSGGRLKP